MSYKNLTDEAEDLPETSEDPTIRGFTSESRPTAVPPVVAEPQERVVSCREANPPAVGEDEPPQVIDPKIQKRFFCAVVVLLGAVQYGITWTQMDELSGPDKINYDIMCAFASFGGVFLAVAGISTERLLYFEYCALLGYTEFTGKVKYANMLSGGSVVISLFFGFLAWCTMVIGHVNLLVSNRFIWWMLIVGSVQSIVVMFFVLALVCYASYSLFKYCCPVLPISPTV